MHLKQIHNENSRYCYDKIQREILLQKLIIAQINDLQQKILRASKGTKTPSQALCQAYTMLREEQKIAFLLAGGGEQLFWYQHQEQEQRGKTDQSSSDPRTDDLPVLCWMDADKSNHRSWEVQERDAISRETPFSSLIQREAFSSLSVRNRGILEKEADQSRSDRGQRSREVVCSWKVA